MADRSLAPSLAAIFVAATVAACPASAGTFAEVTGFGSNPGRLRMFAYAPDALRDPPALVVVMHGCNQNAASYLEHSGWREQADAGGFALVLPQQEVGPGPVFFPGGRNHPTRCLNFAERRDSTRDSGEALSIREMVAHASEAFGVDPGRVFVNGLSAGGGMTAVMLATYPDVFAAGAIIAGVPYRCGEATRTAPAACGVTLQFQPHNPAPDRSPADWGARVRAAAPAGFAGPWPRVAIWQGDADGTVDPPNAIELVEQWTNVHGIDAVPDAEEDVGPAIRRAYHDADGRTLVAFYDLPGFGHATPIDPDAAAEPCGRAGEPFIRDADICSTAAIARFFGLLAAPPVVTIASASVEGRDVVVAGAAEDPDGDLSEVRVRLDGRHPRPEQVASGTAAWTARFEGLADDAFYVPVATATDRAGASATLRGAPVAVGAPPPNAPPALAIDAVAVEGACVDVAGPAADPDGVAEVLVTLGARAPEPAAFDGARFSLRACGLPDGVHATAAAATDTLGARGEASGPDAVVAARIAARGDWLDHLAAQRLRLYAAPCPSVGFGTCDRSFAALHAAHGFAAFDLYRGEGSQDWYADPANVP